MTDLDARAQTYRTLVTRLLTARAPDGAWVGELSSSALSTATAVVALATARVAPDDAMLAERGLQWVTRHQNADGGWGDTTLSASNISTTALCWGALRFASPRLREAAGAVARCEAWLTRAAGGLAPEQLRVAIAARYGKDRTFSAPILTTLAIAGRLGQDGWRLVPQLPFELAACPPQWFHVLQLPVVSYALPALIAIGQARHHQRPSRNMVVRSLRRRCAAPTLGILQRIQPSSGGYLEATPLTSFVVMNLAAMEQGHSTVAREGVRFLRASIREDGSWPIDTNLSTWVTTLSINALAARGELQDLAAEDRTRLLDWLLAQQHRSVHPYTQAPPGGWAWTPLPGGVPDADDTAGAVLALHHLAADEPRALEAAAAGIEWLLDLQNRDGGIPTFCRGWGALPFDRSAPDLTAHALLAWRAWQPRLPLPLARRAGAAVPRAFEYLRRAQQANGSWVPLWFGNQHARDDVNPTYGTSRVALALARVAPEEEMLARGLQWLVDAQNSDGGWGGDAGVPSSIEETAFALEALSAAALQHDRPTVMPALGRAADWLVTATSRGRSTPASPIGFYFAKLWYFEALYPLIFATAALGRATAALGSTAPES